MWEQQSQQISTQHSAFSQLGFPALTGLRVPLCPLWLKFESSPKMSRPDAECRALTTPAIYNGCMPTSVPAEIHGQKYISLTTFRKTGVAVPTAVWFGEEDSKLYVMTRSDMGKSKRIRNNPQVKVAPCTIRGKVTGPEFAATARILPAEEQAHARQTIDRKYWMARIPLIWARTDTYFEISFG